MQRESIQTDEDWRLSCQVRRVLGQPTCVRVVSDAGASASPFSLSACLVARPNSKKVLQYTSHRILRYVYGALNVGEKKLIAQFGWKSRDERFEPN